MSHFHLNRILRILEHWKGSLGNAEHGSWEKSQAHLTFSSKQVWMPAECREGNLDEAQHGSLEQKVKACLYSHPNRIPISSERRNGT